MKKSVASFGRDSVSAGPSGVPYLFLHFPEGDTLNRDTLASSLEFAKREVCWWSGEPLKGSPKSRVRVAGSSNRAGALLPLLCSRAFSFVRRLPLFLFLFLFSLSRETK